MPKKNTQKKTTSKKSKKAPATVTSSPAKRPSVLTNIKHVFSRRSPTVSRNKAGTRILQAPSRYWYNPLTWRHRPPVPRYKPLPKARKLFWVVLKQLWANRILFGGIIVIYGILNLVLVKSLSGSSNLVSMKSALDGIFHGVGGKLFGSTISFTYLLATSGSGNTTTSGIYQAILLLACSLAFIWALRQIIAKRKVRIRDSFYLGMYPVVPFILVFLVICIQLIPLAVGGAAYIAVLNNNIVVGLWEKLLALLIFILLGLWSLRMLTASLFALYIVTLPDMVPLQAYRSARQLVYGRRLLIWRKLIFLPLILLLLSIAIEIPLIYFLTPIASWAFFIISMLTLPIVHGYFYNLYREML